MTRHLFVVSVLLLASLTLGSTARGGVITVQGTANIFGANHAPPNDTPAPGGLGGGTPAPFMLLGSSSGQVIVFDSVTGAVDFGGGMGLNGPDGFASLAYTVTSWNGISGFSANRGAPLVGVFTSATEPIDPAPPTLDFVNNTSFVSLAPSLNQVFYIGDGLTGIGTGQNQQFFVPTGATRLYLGLVDAPGDLSVQPPGGYFNNTGSFVVSVRAVPEPSSLLLALTGSWAVAPYVRRRLWTRA